MTAIILFAFVSPWWEAIEFITELEPLVKDTKNEVILCVPYTDLFYALLTAQNTNIKILSSFWMSYNYIFYIYRF